MIKGDAEEYYNILKEDIKNVVCSETESLEYLFPHLVHYKFESFIYRICNSDDSCLYNKASNDERKLYDKYRRRIAIKKRQIGYEDDEPFETCIFSLNHDLAYHDLKQLEISPLLKVKMESCYTTISELTDIFYKSYSYAFCPINTEYVIAQLKRNKLEEMANDSQEDKQREINNLDRMIENSQADFLRNYKFIIYKISITRV